MRILVRSRVGNAILGVLGVFYVCAAIGLLVFHIVQTWGAAGLIDRALQVVLLSCAAVGLLYIITAVQNLGFRLASRHEARPHREGAVVAR
jgi:hypothetical protein